MWRFGLPAPHDVVVRIGSGSSTEKGFAILLGNLDLREQLPGVSVRALVLYGESEPGAQVGGSEIHDALPVSEFGLIENPGHFSCIEQPEKFLRVVRRFLAGS